MFGKLDERLRKRAQRKAYRETVRRWNEDGGDTAFRFGYPLGPASLVLDVGGYEGQWASDLYARHRCPILVFEPVRAFAESIRTRFADNPEIRVFDFALGGATRSEVIHVRGAGSSTLKRKGAPESIRIVDVGEWFAERDVGEVDLMKLNIEGGEYELLERMLELELLALVRDLQVQFHWIGPDSDRRMAAIQERLAATHEPTYQYRYVWENWRRRAA